MGDTLCILLRISFYFSFRGSPHIFVSHAVLSSIYERVLTYIRGGWLSIWLCQTHDQVGYELIAAEAADDNEQLYEWDISRALLTRPLFACEMGTSRYAFIYGGIFARYLVPSGVNTFLSYGFCALFYNMYTCTSVTTSLAITHSHSATTQRLHFSF